jgi:hypothetical protein
LHQRSVLVTLLEEFYYPGPESGDNDPDHEPRDPERGEEQNEAMIDQSGRGDGYRESLAHEEHRAVVLKHRFVMPKLIDRVFMLNQESSRGGGPACGAELEAQCLDSSPALAAWSSQSPMTVPRVVVDDIKRVIDSQAVR